MPQEKILYLVLGLSVLYCLAQKGIDKTFYDFLNA